MPKTIRISNKSYFYSWELAIYDKRDRYWNALQAGLMTNAEYQRGTETYHPAIKQEYLEAKAWKASRR